MDDLIQHLKSLHEACQNVLSILDDERDDRIAQAIRETCHEVDRRLAEPEAQPS